jgi:hypothetical protein
MDAPGSWSRLKRGASVGGRVADEALLETLRKGTPFFEARGRVREWARERFALGADDPVAVSEVESTVPGSPPLETVVEFRTAEGLRHHFKVFKPLAAVSRDDLPPGWMRDALAMPDGIECECC